MFNFWRQKNFEKLYDEALLQSLNLLKEDWDQAQQTEAAVADVDSQVQAQTKLAKQKFEFMYRQARFRDIKNDHIQSSVYDS
ncbi:YaaL family protein [Fructilactobacillus myrtifloralis]|uniref:YaaL family protein n=1 Tax=Fructilactobacillus myrtifloralis TaxID=2940301 RepID=A0ABY5BP14_9LACO|nr:YaaL family protein [Fructilactobacillus myrtifloralis]USS84931.1 YaaL family protein [Fructilactobacillus myrtifloralis]